jgi:hypothetical protein
MLDLYEALCHIGSPKVLEQVSKNYREVVTVLERKGIGCSAFQNLMLLVVNGLLGEVL